LPAAYEAASKHRIIPAGFGRSLASHDGAAAMQRLTILLIASFTSHHRFYHCLLQGQQRNIIMKTPTANVLELESALPLRSRRNFLGLQEVPKELPQQLAATAFGRDHAEFHLCSLHR